MLCTMKRRAEAACAAAIKLRVPSVRMRALRGYDAASWASSKTRGRSVNSADHNLGPCLRHGAREHVGIERVDDDGVNARGFQLASGLRRARRAGDFMPSGEQQRRQASTNGTARAGEKDSHSDRLTPRP